MAAKVKTEPDGVGHLFPIYDLEPIGAWVGRSLRARNERPVHRQVSELSPLLTQPILPRALSRLMSSLEGLDLNLPALAIGHSALRYYAAFNTPAVGYLIAQDTVGHSSTTLNWKLLGISAIRRANTLTPGVCEICLMEQKRLSQFPHWNIVFAMPGSLFCTKHRAPLLQVCRKCRTENEKKRHWTMLAPQVRCHCGGVRVEAAIGQIEDFAFGMSLDVRSLLLGAVDAYSSEQIFSVIKRRAAALDLQAAGGASRARELIKENKVEQYLSVAYRQTSIKYSLVDVLRGSSLASTPLLNLIGFRVLFGSLEGLVEELQREFGEGVLDRGGLPAFFQKPQFDEQRLAHFRAMSDGMLNGERLTTQQSFMAAIGEEVAYAVAVDEERLKELFRENLSRHRARDDAGVRAGAESSADTVGLRPVNLQPGNRRGTTATDPVTETVIETGGRRLTDTDLAKILCERVAKLKKENPLHQRRTKYFLLQGVIHWVIYYRYHRRRKVPALTAAIDKHYESKDDYRRRIYLNVAERAPEVLHRDMPRSAARIRRATNEELKDWLHRLNFR